ncbi:MAG: hypothetical protein ABIQ93_00265 [Saprospiraceae bacterium]
MKNLLRFCLAICLSLTFGMTALQANTVSSPVPVTSTEPIPDARVQELAKRLEEIKAMDKSNLTAKERKALRKEVRHIKKDIGGGVYISAGVLIVILVLLLILT